MHVNNIKNKHSSYTRIHVPSLQINLSIYSQGQPVQPRQRHQPLQPLQLLLLNSTTSPSSPESENKEVGSEYGSSISSVTVCSSTKYKNRAKQDEDIRQFGGLRIGEEVDIKL